MASDGASSSVSPAPWAAGAQVVPDPDQPVPVLPDQLVAKQDVPAAPNTRHHGLGPHSVICVCLLACTGPYWFKLVCTG